jgi:glutamine amidotransferase
MSTPDGWAGKPAGDFIITNENITMIAILDYEAGNLTSVQRALDFLGEESIITNNPDRVCGADRVIFPGVGAAGRAMSDLKKLKLDQALRKALKDGKPILGICIGTQIIMEWSEENSTPCLGFIRGKVRRFPGDMTDSDGRKLKVPHMGWNGIRLKGEHPVFKGIEPETEFYFVHSYYPDPEEPEEILGETEYGMKFASILRKENLLAVQFHLEKSGGPGLKILANFCGWSGKADA